MSLCGIGNGQKVSKGPRNDEDLLVVHFGANGGQFVKDLGRRFGRFGNASRPRLSPLLGQSTEFLDLLERFHPVVALDDMPQQGPHGPDVVAEGGVLVGDAKVGSGQRGGDDAGEGGGAVVSDGEEGPRLGKAREGAQGPTDDDVGGRQRLTPPRGAGHH